MGGWKCYILRLGAVLIAGFLHFYHHLCSVLEIVLFFTLKSHGKLLLKFDGQLKSSAFFVAAEHLL